jgi:para-aminobenzoate synthetase component 1
VDFELLNSLGRQRKPFLFITDFKAKRVEIILLEDLEKEDVEFSIDENYISTCHPKSSSSHTLAGHVEALQKFPLSFDEYKIKFDKIIEKIEAGETYLLNLTQPTKIRTPLSLKEIFADASAHYKLRYKDEFVCFSPEKFIQISEIESILFL